MGDGIRCFVGLCLTVACYPFRVILIDEPEAFLHPPVSRSLGRWLSGIAEDSGLSLVAATHSPDFLMGCLEASKKLTIIRLTYANSVGAAKQLKKHDLDSFVNEPLLRSTESLASLFHNSAIITEDEKDKIFYSEINRKLLSKKRGSSDAIFLNAHSKYQIHNFVKPLRKSGLPVACIYDLDVIRTKKKEKTNQVKKMWQDIYSSINIDCELKVRLEQERAYIDQEIRKNGINVKKYNPQLVNEELRVRIDSFLKNLKPYGIFIVPIGDLESWTNIPKGENWLKNSLNWINENSITNTGVWNFVDEIKDWSNNPNRLGME